VRACVRADARGAERIRFDVVAAYLQIIRRQRRERTAQAVADHMDGRWIGAIIAEVVGDDGYWPTPISLRLVDDLDSPVTVGWWRPIAFIPAGLVSGIPPDFLDALLAHELAHVKRFEYVINLMQSAIEVVLFYHPAVWWISQQIRIEHEKIADDLAATRLGDTRRLALALQQLDLFQHSNNQFAQAANGGNLMSRIQRLIRPETRSLKWKNVTLNAEEAAEMAALGAKMEAEGKAIEVIAAKIEHNAPNAATEQAIEKLGHEMEEIGEQQGLIGAEMGEVGRELAAAKTDAMREELDKKIAGLRTKMKPSKGEMAKLRAKMRVKMKKIEASMKLTHALSLQSREATKPIREMAGKWRNWV
jgi:ribosome-associated translation inhibitor RaiA